MHNASEKSYLATACCSTVPYCIFPFKDSQRYINTLHLVRLRRGFARRLRFIAMISQLSFCFLMSKWMTSPFWVIYRVYEP